MIYLSILFLVLLVIFVPYVRIALAHPLQTAGNIPTDLYHYFKFKLYNKVDMGKLVGICGYFGAGKTLTGVHLARSFANKWDGTRFFDKGHWIQQRVIILSNVNIKLDKGTFVYMESLADFVSLADEMLKYDKENFTRTLLFVLGDEFGSNMNSRNFKSNIDFDFLSTMLCCRHYSASIYWIAQKFTLCDKLLRDVTQDVYWVHKFWRLCYYDILDASELENAGDPNLIKRRGLRGYFANNRLFSCYDTISMADKLKKDCSEGVRLSADEILAQRGLVAPDPEHVVGLKKKFRKRFAK